MACILDRHSVALLRAVSRGGWALPFDLAAAASISYLEIEPRLTALRHSRVLGPFRALPFLPALLGGDWGRYLIRVYKSDLGLEDKLTQNLTGLEESIHNACFATRRFPRTSFFCFSRTKEELKLTLRNAGVEDDPWEILSYNFPFSSEPSDDERLLLRAINSTGEIIPHILARHLERDSKWVEAKLKRLVLHSDNPQGMVILRATIHWYRIDNFVHTHVLLPVDTREHLADICRGFEYNELKMLGDNADSLAVEIDFKGWGSFAEWKELVETKGFPVSGFAFFAEERVWGKGFEF